MEIKKITVVGGGTAGSLASAFLQRDFPQSTVTLIHSDKIPKIGVGESLTPHMASIINGLGVDEKKFMRETGSIFKYGNSMEGWTDRNVIRNFRWAYDIEKNEDWHNSYNTRPTDLRSIDVWIDVQNNNLAPDLYMYHHISPFYQYAKQKKMPFDNDFNYMMSTTGNYTYHINTEKVAPWLIENVCKPKGVIEKISTITKVNTDETGIKNVELETGEVITSDIWVDCSGLSRVLIKELTQEFKEYEANIMNSAWVSPLKYDNKEEEIVNYTRSIANEMGWYFHLPLFDRIGSGQIYSDKYFSDEDALEHYKNIIGNKNLKEPRLLKWHPGRLEKPNVGNCFAVGMAAGFVDPLEATAIATGIAGMKRISWMFNRNLDKDYYNRKMNYYFDDIAEFISVHYTLSHRNDNKFWKDMKQLGKKLNHVNLIKDKIYNEANCVDSNVGYVTAFPDAIWLCLANNWVRDLKDYPQRSTHEQQIEYIKKTREEIKKHTEQGSKNKSILDFYKNLYTKENYTFKMKTWPLWFYQEMWQSTTNE
tara:strand:+ start:562 stop:2166 length:1605 start_codon:yes stop_codon:yes gene_type:complete